MRPYAKAAALEFHLAPIFCQLEGVPARRLEGGDQFLYFLYYKPLFHPSGGVEVV
jgi:hypothetical protein